MFISLVNIGKSKFFAVLLSIHLVTFLMFFIFVRLGCFEKAMGW